MRRLAALRAVGPARLAAATSAVIAAAAIVAPSAAAHVGAPTTVLSAGPYRIAVTAAPVAAGPHRAALAFRAAITAPRHRLPAARSSVRLVVETAVGAPLGRYRLSGFGGVESLNVPIPSVDGWRSLRFVLLVDGPLGNASARYVPPDLFDQWSFEPIPLALAGLAAVLFAQGFVRLRRRGRSDRAGWGRLALFLLGLSAMVLPLVSPLDAVSDHLLSAHMLQHVLIGDVGPALLVLSLRGPLLFFALPAAVLRLVGRAAWLRRAASWLQRPKVVVAVWAVAFFAWHVPGAYDYAATHQWAHDLEHASFVFAGLLLWSLLIDPAGRAELSRGTRLAVAACVFAMGTVIADILIFSLHPLYPAYAGQVERVFGLSALHDQQLAGLVMIVEQILTLGTFAAVLLLPGLRARRRGAFLAGQERLA